MVIDANDAGGATWLDSDGVASSSANLTQRAPGDGAPLAAVDDGGWHMVTLSTLPSRAPGYALFVDGAPAGELFAAKRLPDGAYATPAGGDAVLMTGNITLCARADLAESDEEARYYDGAVAHLAVFDAPLTAEHVALLYAAYTAGGGAGGLSAAAAGGADDGGGSGLSGGEIAGIVLVTLGAAALLATALALLIAHRRRQSAARFQPYREEEAPPPCGGAGAGAGYGSPGGGAAGAPGSPPAAWGENGSHIGAKAPPAYGSAGGAAAGAWGGAAGAKLAGVQLSPLSSAPSGSGSAASARIKLGAAADGGGAPAPPSARGSPSVEQPLAGGAGRSPGGASVGGGNPFDAGGSSSPAGSAASRSGGSEDIEIQAGRRTLLPGGGRSARIVVPDDLKAP
jgi:hypothetical protein